MSGLILSFLAGVFTCITVWAVMEVKSVENWNR